MKKIFETEPYEPQDVLDEIAAWMKEKDLINYVTGQPTRKFQIIVEIVEE